MTAQQTLPQAADPGLAHPIGAPVTGSVLKLKAPSRRSAPLVDFKRPVGATVKFILGCCAWAVFLGLLCSAWTPAAGENPTSTVMLNLPENVPLKVLIEYVSKRHGVNFLYDDAIAKDAPYELENKD